MDLALEREHHELDTLFSSDVVRRMCQSCREKKNGCSTAEPSDGIMRTDGVEAFETKSGVAKPGSNVSWALWTETLDVLRVPLGSHTQQEFMTSQV